MINLENLQIENWGKLDNTVTVPPQSLTYLLEAIKHLKSAPLVLDPPCSMPGQLIPDTASLCGGEYCYSI